MSKSRRKHATDGVAKGGDRIERMITRLDELVARLQRLEMLAQRQHQQRGAGGSGVGVKPSARQEKDAE